MKNTLLVAALIVGGSLMLSAQRGGTFVESLDHEAIRYSTAPLADPVSALRKKIDAKTVKLTQAGESGYLKSLLDALAIAADSQMLVFSETSADAKLITPKNPRSIFFNDTVAVGWTRGSERIEIAAQDPRQGTVFYTLDQRNATIPRFARDKSCLLCHQTADTSGVPGWLVFSTFTVPKDKYSYATGAAVDHRSTILERWGGWYVTGKVDGRHLGNVPEPDGIENARKRPARQLATVQGEFDTHGYLSAHSDAAALMVLDHQAQMTNLVTRMAWETRVAIAGRPAPQGAAAGALPERVRDAAVELVDYLLFVDEVPLPGPIEGSSGFQARFAALGPRDTRGRSLRELDLKRRLLRYPCSYMIYSEAFDAIPEPGKTAVYDRMWRILSGAETDQVYKRLTLADRQAVVEILRDTKKELPTSFRTPIR